MQPAEGCQVVRIELEAREIEWEFMPGRRTRAWGYNGTIPGPVIEAAVGLADRQLVIVGDASMSPYEITHAGGSIEHFNEEAGAVWMERITRTYPACVWLNPVPESEWDYTQSIRMMKQLMGGRMYPLTLEGLDRAMRIGDIRVIEKAGGRSGHYKAG